MPMPEFFRGVSITRFLQGAAAGVVVTLIVGFTWGGWVTSATAMKTTDAAVNATQVTLYSPVCVERYMAKATPEQRAAFAKEDDWNRDTVIEKAGFATPPGSTSPNDAVADECAARLSKQLKDAAVQLEKKG
jgi:alpha/beta superfamily hydrolase